MIVRKKQKVVLFLSFVICFISTVSILAFWMHEYRQNSLTYVSKLCQIIIEDYPDAETQVLSSLKKYHTDTDQEIQSNDFLAQYGYRDSDFVPDSQQKFFILVGVVFLVTVCTFFFQSGICTGVTG